MPLSSEDAMDAFRKVLSRGYGVVFAPAADTRVDWSVDHYRREVLIQWVPGYAGAAVVALNAAVREIDAERATKVIDFRLAKLRREVLNRGGHCNANT